MPIDNNPPFRHNACLVFEDGTVFWGMGFGYQSVASAELCFNTSMTGYQEIVTDPSYAGQIIAFTFPHIGNVGTNSDDQEAEKPIAKGIVVHTKPSAPSNWRSELSFDEWLSKNNVIGLYGIDTRYLAKVIRYQSAPKVTLAYHKNHTLPASELIKKSQRYPAIVGQDLAKSATRFDQTQWQQGRWFWPNGYNKNSHKKTKSQSAETTLIQKKPRVVAIDYGAKNNTLRCLTEFGCDVIVLPAQANAQDILAHHPQGLFLSNGPGDPAAMSDYAIPTIQRIINDTTIPIFGICLGHQLLALALGGGTVKMNHGHHGANHPVRNNESGRIEITSMNHGFMVDPKTLPQCVIETHTSLFDHSNCGLRVKNRPIFSVQYHPEASPGPKDSFYLFKDFVKSLQ